MDPAPAVTRPDADVRGLTSEQVRARLARDGPNVMPAPRAPSPLVQLARQLVHFFAIIRNVLSTNQSDVIY